MRFTTSSVLALVAGLAVPVSSTGIVLPLYIYPSAVWNDGAANWKPAFDAIAAHPDLQFLVVLNPASGPGHTFMPGNNDTNYVTGVAKLNAFPNVKTIGYSRTNYATSPLDELKKNITAWANWSSYTAANIGVDGLFLDESSNTAYLSEAATFARQTFGRNITVFCHFGAAAPDPYYNICDVVGSFESYASYLTKSTMSQTIPSGRAKQAAIIIHDFTGKTGDGINADANALNQYIQTMYKGALGWLYFCSGYFTSMSVGPATIGQVANNLATAQGPSKSA